MAVVDLVIRVQKKFTQTAIKSLSNPDCPYDCLHDVFKHYLGVDDKCFKIDKDTQDFVYIDKCDDNELEKYIPFFEKIAPYVRATKILVPSQVNLIFRGGEFIKEQVFG